MKKLIHMHETAAQTDIAPKVAAKKSRRRIRKILFIVLVLGILCLTAMLTRDS